MFSKVCIYLGLFSVIVRCKEAQNYTTYFIKMVQDNVSAAEYYIFPTSNEEENYINSHDVNTYGTFDFIVVGAGSAGSILANRLSEVSHWKILLLEAGGEQNDFTDVPGTAAWLSLSDMNWGYNSTPQTSCCLGMNGRSCSVTRGKVIGGSSTTDARIYIRGNEEDYKTWEQMGNPGWSYRKVLPYFIKSENFHRSVWSPADLIYHGAKGPLTVNYTEPTPFTSIFLEACQLVGLPIVDYNGRTQIGVSQAQFMIKGTKMESGGRVFLDPIRQRKNLNITTRAFVTKVLIDKSKLAYGVEFVINHKKYIAKASKEVILSAGVYNSPKILMLSGIGPKKELNELGIHVISDLPVGKNLQDPPVFFGLNFRTNQSVYNEKSMVDLLKDYLKGQPPFTIPFAIDTLSFVNVDDQNNTVPNVKLLFTAPAGVPGSYSKLYNLKEDIDKKIDPHTDVLIFVIVLDPKSRGSVTLNSRNASDFPVIDFNLFSVEDDIETMYKGILKVLQIIDTKPFKAVNATYVPLVGGCDNYKELSKEYWYCAIRELSTHFYRPVGSTRMGQSVKTSVVSSYLKVHGIKRLRVIDAGVMPKINSGSTNVPTYMIAEKLSDQIKDSHKALHKKN